MIVTYTTIFGRAVLLATLAGAAAAPVTLGASTGSQAVPTPSKARPCRAQGPMVLRAGRAPLAPLRLDLGKVANERRAQVYYDHVSSIAKIGSNPARGLHTTRKAVSTYTTRSLDAHGHVPVSIHNATFFPTSPRPKTALDAYTIKGYVDALNGGTFGTDRNGHGGTAENDHLPVQPVGIGATWRVVDCTGVFETPAKIIRVYTLRSIAGGVIRATYRDDVELDPAAANLGSQKVAGSTLSVRLLNVHGSAQGTLTLPVEDGFRERLRTVSHITVTTRATAGGQKTLIRSKITDTATQAPAA